MPLPKDAKARKEAPVFSGVLRYFPDALVAIAECSKKGNDQHNPGSPLHWDRSKSQDEHDALVRHLIEAGTLDTDGIRHSAKVAWRALAALQKEIEAEQAKKDSTILPPASADEEVTKVEIPKNPVPRLPSLEQPQPGDRIEIVEIHPDSEAGYYGLCVGDCYRLVAIEPSLSTSGFAGWPLVTVQGTTGAFAMRVRKV